MTQTIEEALVATATAEPTIAARIGARLCPAQGPYSAATPFALYGEAEQEALRALARNVNLNRYRLHVDFYADSYGEAKLARNAFKAFFSRFRGTVGDATLRVSSCFEETGDDGAEAPIHADEMGLFRAGLDLTFYYRTN